MHLQSELADKLTFRVTTYKYWIVGSLTNNISEATFLSALINAVGSLGSTFGFVVSKMNFDYNGACALNFALFWLSMPGLAWVVYTKVHETSHGTSLTGIAKLQESPNDSSATDAPASESKDRKTSLTINEKNPIV